MLHEAIRMPLTSARPLIMYELNEVPWEVIDFYRDKNPNSCISMVVGLSKCYTTYASDVGELHPWVTWPTLHRGVDNRVHKIEVLHEDLSEASAYPPLWETAAKAGKRVGVFGSMQSYPVPQDGSYAFYVPDTFAPTADALPRCYVPLQELNLRQTAADSGIVSAVKLDWRTVRNILRLLRTGLSLKTLVRLGWQLVLERRAPAYKARRAVLQAPIGFDVFKHALRKHKPELCTFFTNHVAGVMHRYWRHTFPGDFGEEASAKADPVRSTNVEYAMHIADEQIAYLKRHADKVGATLLIVSSMGQEAVHRRGGDQARIVDVDKFARTIGFAGPFKSHLAMHPYSNLEFETEQDAHHFAELLSQYNHADRRPVAYKIHVKGRTLNFGLAQPSDRRSENFIMKSASPGTNQTIDFEDAGIIRFERDVGTGYHQPRGIAIWYEPGGSPDDSRMQIDTRDIRPMVLSALGVPDRCLSAEMELSA